MVICKSNCWIRGPSYKVFLKVILETHIVNMVLVNITTVIRNRPGYNLPIAYQRLSVTMKRKNFNILSSEKYVII